MVRERVTYVLHQPYEAFNPRQLEVTDQWLAINSLDAIKEHTATFTTKDNLPPELKRLLRNVHELHIRWSSPAPYNTLPPYVAFIPPGLHVSYTPLPGKNASRLCNMLKDVFGKDHLSKCDEVDKAFTAPRVVSDRFAGIAARQFYAFLPSLRDSIPWIQREICGDSDEQYACRLHADGLKRASTLDMDYDAVSQKIEVKALWTRGNGVDDDKWYETQLKGQKDGDGMEVGVLINETPLEHEELRFSGWLTQLSKDKKPSNTLFSTPSRHHPFPAADVSFKANFLPPVGLHPTLTLSINAPPVPPHPDCRLHAYFTLPSTLFFDRYAFDDPLFLKSHNLVALHALSGATDLEAPEWTVPQWGSAALFELATPAATDSQGGTKLTKSFDVTFPMHLRYLPPSNFSSQILPIPYPSLFHSCPAEKGARYSSSPFDKVNLGYDGLFGTNTQFYHIRPAGVHEGLSRAVAALTVPVMDLQKTKWVEKGTMGIVALGTIWVLWVLLRVVLRYGYGRRAEKSDQKKKQ